MKYPPSSVSVIIPAWNAASTIDRAVRSVLDQTQAVTEILVIDDGSSDDTASVAESVDAAIRVIRQPNGGASSARNRGLEMATGDWVAFLDADDAWLPVRIERQLQVARLNPRVSFIFSAYLTDNSDHGRIETCPVPPAIADRVLDLSRRQAFDCARHCSTITVMIRRQAIATNRFRPDLQTAEDVEFWLRILADNPGYAISEPLAMQHMSAGSLSQIDVDADAVNLLRVVEENAELFSKSELRRWHERHLRVRAGVHLAAGRPDRALGPAWERVVHRPWEIEPWWILARAMVGLLKR